LAVNRAGDRIATGHSHRSTVLARSSHNYKLHTTTLVGLRDGSAVPAAEEAMAPLPLPALFRLLHVRHQHQPLCDQHPGLGYGDAVRN